MNKKILTIIFSAVFGVTALQATPPLKRVYPHRQQSGQIVMIQKHGDGTNVFYTTTNGTPLLINNSGNLCYAKNEASNIVCSDIIYNEGPQKLPNDIITNAIEFAKILNTTHETKQRSSRALNAINSDGLGTYGKPSNGCVKSIGEIRIPVIMVEFPDMTFAETTTIEKVSRMLNEKGYHDEQHTKGSVKDYFENQSSELFSPNFEIVAKVTADNSYAEYGKNSGSKIDIGTQKLILEAINKAENQGADFTKYYVDGNVPLVNIFYAGPGEHSSFEEGCENYLWAHFTEHTFTSNNGARIKSYFIGNEIFQTYKRDENGILTPTSSKLDGIGVFCHEFSHALGLPDFYYTGSDTNIYESLMTMDFWSIMDYGQYAYDGYAPVPYTAYEKCYMGWLDIKELTPENTGENKLYATGVDSVENTAYLIRSDAKSSEYYILENRQETSVWHPAFLGTGMLVLHVDYDSNSWSYNRPNNDPNHQRMQYIPADSHKQSNSKKTGWNDYKGDLFPGITKNYQLTDTSTPAAETFATPYLGKPIYDISEENEVITFFYLKDKEASAINTPVIDTPKIQSLYDIYGRQIANPVKGNIYIKNGKKIIF